MQNQGADPEEKGFSRGDGQTTARAGRRSLLRGVALGLLALVAPGVASDAAQAQTATPAIAQMQSVGVGGGRSSPAGPTARSGRWSRVGEQRRLAVARYDASGRVPAVQSGDIWALSDLAPLAGGGMGFVSGDEPTWSRPSRVSLNTTDAAGERIRSRETLPREARLADAFAIAGDGSVWFADTCGNQAVPLAKWRPARDREAAEGAVRGADREHRVRRGQHEPRCRA